MILRRVKPGVILELERDESDAIVLREVADGDGAVLSEIWFTVEDWHWLALIAGPAILPPFLSARQRENARAKPADPPPPAPPASPVETPAPRSADAAAVDQQLADLFSDAPSADQHEELSDEDPLGETVQRETPAPSEPRSKEPAAVPPAIREAAERFREQEIEARARASEPLPPEIMQLALESLPSLLDA